LQLHELCDTAHTCTCASTKVEHVERSRCLGV